MNIDKHSKKNVQYNPSCHSL